YVRERVFAYYFGNDSIPADAFRAALRIPNTIRSLLGEGTLLGSFIPVYAALNERADKRGARALAGAILGLLLLGSGILALLGIAFAPAITTVLAKGFDEPRRQLTISLVRILFPMTGLMVISAWCLGILNTHRRFFLPYAAPALWNIAGIVALVGSFTGAGGVSALGYAQIVQQLPISLFGASVTAVALPELAREAVGTAPNEQLRSRIGVGFRRIVFFVVPSSIAFIVLNRVIIGALFQTGRFTADATQLVGNVLAAYGLGLVGQATVKLFASGFYAMRDTRTPVKIATSSLVVSTTLAWLLMRWLGAPGIALGSSLGVFLNTSLHLYHLNGRIGG